MNRYHDLLAHRRSAGSIDKLGPVADEHISALLRDYPRIPEDFTDFLRGVGAGAIGPDRYYIYNGLVEPQDIFSDAGFSGVVLFGDDQAGVSNGFDTQDWHLVEIDSASGTCRTLNLSFEAFIRDIIEGLA